MLLRYSTIMKCIDKTSSILYTSCLQYTCIRLRLLELRSVLGIGVLIILIKIVVDEFMLYAIVASICNTTKCSERATNTLWSPAFSEYSVHQTLWAMKQTLFSDKADFVRFGTRNGQSRHNLGPFQSDLAKTVSVRPAMAVYHSELFHYHIKTFVIFNST